MLKDVFICVDATPGNTRERGAHLYPFPKRSLASDNNFHASFEYKDNL